MDIYLKDDVKADQEKAVAVAKNILQTTVNDLIVDTETDYATEISLYLEPRKLNDRNCTINDVKEALTNKKFDIESTGNTILLKLKDKESDVPAVIAVKSKVLKTTVKGVPDVERVTVKKENNEWIIQTTGSNLSKAVSYTHLPLPTLLLV